MIIITQEADFYRLYNMKTIFEKKNMKSELRRL